MKKLFVVVILLLLLLGCIPLEITNITASPEGENCYCVKWNTNQETACKITYCDSVTGLCYTNDLEPEYTFRHSQCVPNTKQITITAIGRDGKTAMRIWSGQQE